MVITSKLKIGPRDQGRKMSLKAFEFVEVEEGYVSELARGYLIVSGVPSYHHGSQIDVIQDHLRFYKVGRPGLIHRIMENMSCKLLVTDYDSERHPDFAIYLSRPNGPLDDTIWRKWIPDIIIEVVSPRSADRDYVEKRDEYWSLGVKEYWIVDANIEKVLVLRRGRNDWIEKELYAADSCETKLLPGFKMPCRAIFEAAQETDEQE